MSSEESREKFLRAIEGVFSLSIEEAGEIFEKICRTEYDEAEYQRRFQEIENIALSKSGGEYSPPESERVTIVLGYLGKYGRELEKVHFIVLWFCKRVFQDPETKSMVERIKKTNLMLLVIQSAIIYKQTEERVKTLLKQKKTKLND